LKRSFPILFLLIIFFQFHSGGQTCDSLILIHHIYFDDGDITDYGYETDSIENGNVVSKTDSNNTFARYYYDGQNRLASFTNFYQADSTVYSYDSFSRHDITDYYSGSSGNWSYNSDSARSRNFFRTNGSDSLYVRYKWSGTLNPFYKRVYYYNANDTLYKWEIQVDTGAGFHVDTTFNVFYVNGMRVDSGFYGTVLGQNYDWLYEYDSLGRLTQSYELLSGFYGCGENYNYACNQLSNVLGGCGTHAHPYYYVEFDSLCNVVYIQHGVSSPSADHYDRYDYYYSSCYSIATEVSHHSSICNHDSTALSVIFMGGTPPYNISWTPSAGLAFPDSAFTRASPDTTTDYIVTITDSNGVIVSDTVRVTVYPNPYTALQIQNIDTVSPCQSAVLTTDSIVGCWNYWYLNGTGIQTNQTSHLTITKNGTYVLGVNSPQCPAAYDTVAINFFSHPSPTLTLSRGCGQLFASTSTPCQLQWYSNGNLMNGFTNDTIPVITSGDYSAIAIDSSGCQSGQVSIYYYQNSFSFIKRNSCSGTCSGQLSFDHSPTTVTWYNGSHANSMTGLCPGIYSATVTDYFGCAYSLSDSIGTYADVNLQPIISPASSVSACDGTVAFVDSLNNAHVSNVFWPDGTVEIFKDSLCSGWYYVQIVPFNTFCTEHDSVYVGSVPATDTCSVIFNAHNVSCHGQASGSIHISSSTGHSFASILTDGVQQTTYQSFFSNCGPGTYTAILIDSSGCKDTSSIVLTEPAAINTSLTNYQSSCGDSCYTLINVTGGTPPYAYQWCDGSTNQYVLSCQSVCFYQVTDANNCLFYGNLNQPPVDPIVINAASVPASCMTCSDATIYINATGGVAPLTYSYDGNLSSNDSLSSQFLPGIHTVCAIGADSCRSCQTIYVSFAISAQNLSINNPILFPNPAADHLTIQLTGKSNFAEYEILDYTGRIVQNGRLAGDESVLKLNLNSGIYFIRIKNSDSFSKQMFVISR
jgi:YD repeat-containing protein